MQIIYRLGYFFMVFTSVAALFTYLYPPARKSFQIGRAIALMFWLLAMEIGMVVGIELSHRHWDGALYRFSYMAVFVYAGLLMIQPHYRKFCSGQLRRFIVGNGHNVHLPHLLLLRFMFCRSPDQIEREVLATLRGQTRQHLKRPSRSSEAPESAGGEKPTASIRSRRQEKLANYSPAAEKPVRPEKPQAALRTVATVRHVFLRDIEDERLQIANLLPARADEPMAREILRSLLVLGRRQALNQSQYVPWGYVYHRVSERYQKSCGRPFDPTVFDQTLGILVSQGIVILKKKQGRSEKVMFSLRSVPSETESAEAAQIVQMLNRLKQDAFAGRLV